LYLILLRLSYFGKVVQKMGLRMPCTCNEDTKGLKIKGGGGKKSKNQQRTEAIKKGRVRR